MKLGFIFVILWFSVAVGGLVYLVQYENTPAEKTGAYPQIFPTASRIERHPTLPTLIFFSHPKCPCTRASLRELARLITDVNGKLHVVVVFIKPSDAEANWAETDLRRSAEAIPGVTVLIDDGEQETKIFNAQTSGLNLLYDQNGDLRFDGGITAGRGHEGDNTGRNAIFQIVTESQTQFAETDVFGCSFSQKESSGEIIQNAQ